MSGGTFLTEPGLNFTDQLEDGSRNSSGSDRQQWRKLAGRNFLCAWFEWSVSHRHQPIKSLPPAYGVRGKVMFWQASVLPSIHLSVHRGGWVRYPPRGVWVSPPGVGGSGTPPGGIQVPPGGGQVPPGGGPGTPGGGQVPPWGGSGKK